MVENQMDMHPVRQLHQTNWQRMPTVRSLVFDKYVRWTPTSAALMEGNVTVVGHDKIAQPSLSKSQVEDR